MLPVISADREEACLIVCVQYVITLSSGSETSLIICLHTFQTNWQRSSATRGQLMGRSVQVKPHTTLSISCIDEYITWQCKSRTKGDRPIRVICLDIHYFFNFYQALPAITATGAHRTPEGRSAERCHLCNKKTDLPRLTPLNCSLLSRCQYHGTAPSLKCEEEQKGGDISVGHDT